MTKESERTIAAVEAAFQLLDAFDGAGALRLADLHERTGLTRSRILRLLGTLEVCGYVVASGKGQYVLGPKIFRLGWSMRDAYSPMISVLRPALERAVADSGVTAFFSIPRGDQRVVLAKCEPSSGVRYVVEEGQARALHVGATGRVLLANMEPELVDAALSGGRITALTPATIIDADELRASIDSARAEQFAVSFGEATSTAFAMAAPVLSGSRLVGALSLAGPLEDYEARREVCREILEREARFLGSRIA
ncbi:IclR family transcriptional regulator [Paracoccus laeviglucosivorans]|uniref:Transcriptional regulator, IclR family n=1 Tax=Paracoccus laeviglucosivorans TaxID=1197861 RepID=A0A521FTZ9_9RHOB|nr:IclR family transcriptional regulator [Paracoccus laeviglucosivorans]SMO99582.1 transcriptional regulator, IclR family [Paracoccus laeviglucosivorans]